MDGGGGWSGREHGSWSHSAADLVLLQLDPRKQPRPVRSWRRPAEETLCVIFLLRFTLLVKQDGNGSEFSPEPQKADPPLVFFGFEPPHRGTGRSAAPCTPRRLDNCMRSKTERN
ncbi:hypothetical protein ATANTOWER_005420 [Ataeniobius toweri]|uniref:Uncharacterized protein n=1 Tax=Ataeniobius toweri TaxID=208326 RepID=A0ABU7ADT1_9TELE|nr:hypothetical protein [Ataeniobius toweri]